MRDIFVLFFTGGAASSALARPWLGVLALAVLAYMNPHRYAWGFSRGLPVFLIVFVATMISMFFNSKERQPFPWTRETGLFVGLLSWFTLTTFVNPDFPDEAKDQLVKVMKVYLGIFPMFWLITDYRKLRWLLIAICLSFGLLGLKGGIFAFGTGFNYRVWGPDNTFYGGNNEFAMVLNMMLPLFLLCAKEMEKNWAKRLFQAIFFFSICSVISSWSRGGLLGLCAVIGLMLLRSKRKWLVAPLLVIGLFLALPNLPESWFDRMHSISTYEEDSSAMGRIEAWGYAFDRAVESPILGGGFETYIAFGLDMHSAYFEILSEHGFVALSLWVSLVFGTIVALGRLSRRAGKLDNFDWVKEYAAALQISLVGYAVGAAFLGAAYWEILYQLIGFCVLMKVFVQRELDRQKLSVWEGMDLNQHAENQNLTHPPLS